MPSARVRESELPEAPHNWNRWGPEDERGTANFITPVQVAAAAQLIRSGRVISCAAPLGSDLPLAPHRTAPLHFFRPSGADFVAGERSGGGPQAFPGVEDFLAIPLHSATHWDGLCHCFRDQAMYNGFWIGEVDAFAGARRNSVHQLADSLVGRGVLLDIARHQGVARLEPGFAITPQLLDAAASAQGVEISSGDILLIRTGHLPWYLSLDDKSVFGRGGQPGLGRATIGWLHEHEIAAVGVDNTAVEVLPPDEPGEYPFPLHVRLIRDLGLTIGELWYLEEIADACASDGAYAFFLCAPPLAIQNASASPINPIAIK